ncbi:hypothetical protein FNW52_12475 [Flavobacterium sp. ZT3R18]|uniref:hypothetical protein n=1 Tax=Flavobacterium sp. ZT3R18 TaxID=2594429 RepID=UPI00117AA83B|nr:hypothetical protein [Flavobacterium sp. ZT3R18]TRX34950.1 hypothetical protein FNW52_12475 [Flavobacterium sp. ZT3R18]
MNIDRLKELLQIPFDELSSNAKLKNEVTDFYKVVFNVKVCTSCKDKFSEYYKKLIDSGITKDVEVLDNEIANNFKLRNDLGVSKITFDNGQFISQNECDDDVAIGFLQANPNRISMFEKYPENWKELIENNETENEYE